MLSDALYLGCCFFLIYVGYNAMQIELPADQPRNGPITIALSYFAYAISPWIDKAFVRTKRISFTIAAATFLLWIIISPINILTLTGSSIVNGAGAGLLWSTEGAWLSSYPQKYAQTLSFVILFSFHLATIVGEVINYYIDDVYFVAIGSCATALCLLAFIPGVFLGENNPETARLRTVNVNNGDDEFELSITAPNEEGGGDVANDQPGRLMLCVRLMNSRWFEIAPNIWSFGFYSSSVWVMLPMLMEDTTFVFVTFSTMSIICFILMTTCLGEHSLWSCKPKLDPHVYCCIANLLGSAAFIYHYFHDPSDEILFQIFFVILIASSNAMLNQSLVVAQTRLGELSEISFSAQVSLYCIVYAMTSFGYALSIVNTAGVGIFVSFFLVFYNIYFVRYYNE